MARVLLQPLYGLGTAFKDWCETILDFLADGRGGVGVVGGGYSPIYIGIHLDSTWGLVMVMEKGSVAKIPQI